MNNFGLGLQQVKGRVVKKSNEEEGME